MSSSTRKKIDKALLRALQSLAKILLGAGIGYREFSEVAKQAFVTVATRDYGIRGRETNVSRVAVMTGLTRKEVKKIRDSSKGLVSTGPLRLIPSAAILHRWHTESNYVDEFGKPKVLAFDGGGDDFTSLVRKYAGDIPPGAIRTELKRTGAIKLHENGQLEALRRDFPLVESEERLLRAIDRPLTAMLLNLEHNNGVRDSKFTSDNVWEERIVETRNLKTKELARLRRITRDQVIGFSESLDDVFSLHDDPDSSTEDKVKSIGVGLYYFET